MTKHPNGVHPNLGANWHARMTELATALLNGEYRGTQIETIPDAQAEAKWVLDEILFKDDNHEQLKYTDENYHPKWAYTKLIPANLSDADQDRWIAFMESAIDHFKALGIPTDQYGSTFEAGDDYVQTLEKLELKLDPSRAKGSTAPTVKSELAELKELVMSMTQLQLEQAERRG